MIPAIDRRAAKTRKALHKALMTLILKKGYEEITVQDLLDEADVGRSTFYAHYTGKEDLLRRGFAMLRGEMASLHRSEGGETRPLAFSLGLFRHVAAYAHIFRALIGGRGGLVAAREVRQILFDLVKGELPGEDLPVHFVTDTFFTVLTWWLEKNPKLMPEEVDPLFRRLALEGIGGGQAAATPLDRANRVKA